MPATLTPACSIAPVMFIRHPQSPATTVGGAGVADVGHLVRDHGGRYRRLLDGEGAPEPTAFGLALQLHQGHVFQLPEKGLGILDDIHLAQGVTGAVPGYRQRLPLVFELDRQHRGQVFRPFINPVGKPACGSLIGRAGEQVRVVMLHHAGTGSGRHHDRVGFVKHPYLLAGNGPGLADKTGIVRRLAAAGLVLGKDHFHPLGFQQADGRHPGIGIDGIHQAGTEQVDGLGSVGIVAILHSFTLDDRHQLPKKSAGSHVTIAGNSARTSKPTNCSSTKGRIPR